MVRCEEFYKYFEKKGNFCNKSDVVVKKVETYIDYVKRNRIGTYKISNCALDPLINIEYLKDGIVHRTALKELKNLLKKGKILPEKITRRMTVEMINKANNKVGLLYKLDSIPNIRKRIGEYEHEIGSISHENRDVFDILKKDIGTNNNNITIQVMLEMCIRNPDEVRKIKEEISNKENSSDGIEIITTT